MVGMVWTYRDGKRVLETEASFYNRWSKPLTAGIPPTATRKMVGLLTHPAEDQTQGKPDSQPPRLP